MGALFEQLANSRIRGLRLVLAYGIGAICGIAIAAALLAAGT